MKTASTSAVQATGWELTMATSSSTSRTWVSLHCTECVLGFAEACTLGEHVSASIMAMWMKVSCGHQRPVGSFFHKTSHVMGLHSTGTRHGCSILCHEVWPGVGLHSILCGLQCMLQCTHQLGPTAA